MPSPTKNEFKTFSSAGNLSLGALPAAEPLSSQKSYPGRYVLPSETGDSEWWFRQPMRKNISVPSCQALKHAVSTLYRIDDFHREKIGAGFFSEVFKVTHKTTGKVMVLKLNKHHANRINMLKEVQLLNKLNHPNILRFEAACVHEGQLHALTEYVNGGSLEQLIQRKEEELPWSVRMSLALDTARGLAYLHSKGFFHRDLTSKNVLIKRASDGRLSAVLGDFGLAAKIPTSTTKDFRLPQVGSPYWMSPECLRGTFYDQRADSFSYGIILCELIGRLDADPDVLPRTENFGVDYIAFSEMCPTCPPDFLKLAFSCVRIDPLSRPTSSDLVIELENLLEIQIKHENRQTQSGQQCGKILLRKVGHKRSLSEEEVTKRPPSEKARFHYRPTLSVKCIGKEMSLRDPYYRPSNNNPFATLPRLREGRKIIGSSRDLFSSCFELPSPARAATPTASNESSSSASTSYLYFGPHHQVESKIVRRGALSLPSSPTLTESRSFEDDLNPKKDRRRQIIEELDEEDKIQSPLSRCFDDHLFHGRVRLLRRIYSGGNWVTQDDSALELSSTPKKNAANGGGSSSSSSSKSGGYPAPTTSVPLLKRRGSCESGFFSSIGTDDWHMDVSSNRSVGSSLLTVSDLEEDLRAASAFLSSSNKRTSSIFTDSTDDLSSLAENDSDHIDRGYEKDIRDIVEYFEQTCRVVDRRSGLRNSRMRHQEMLNRSQKIDSLIKRVVEKESRERLFRKTPQQQICEGIVRSKLPLFDHTKKPTRRSRMPFDQKGFVKARMALFDKPSSSSTTNSNCLLSSSKHQPQCSCPQNNGIN